MCLDAVNRAHMCSSDLFSKRLMGADPASVDGHGAEEHNVGDACCLAGDIHWQLASRAAPYHRRIILRWERAACDSEAMATRSAARRTLKRARRTSV